MIRLLRIACARACTIGLICERLHCVKRLPRIGAEKSGKGVDSDDQIAAPSLLPVTVAGQAVLNSSEVKGLVLIKARIGPQIVGPVRELGEGADIKKVTPLRLRSGRQITLCYLRDDAMARRSPRKCRRGESEKQ